MAGEENIAADDLFLYSLVSVFTVIVDSISVAVPLVDGFVGWSIIATIFF